MHTLKIFLKLCELNFKKLLAYRASFWISLILMIVWVAAYVVMTEVIFYHTNTLAGWNKGQVIIILGFYYVIQNFSDIFFKDNFENFGESVRRGDLDFKLVKPVSTRLLSFFWEMRFDHIAGLFVTAGLFIYGFKNLTEPIAASAFISGVVLAFAGLILYFSILSLIGTLTFWIEKNDTFNMLIFHLTQLSRYPRQMYHGIIGRVLTFGLPLAALASVPAEVAFSFKNGIVPVYFVGLSIFFYLLSYFLWQRGLKKYSSAN